jgi:SulP family sulfate permease
LTIASTQLQDFFGIQLPSAAPGDFIGRIWLWRSMRRWPRPRRRRSAPAWCVLIVVWNRLVPRVPGYIVALFAGTIVAAIAGLPVATIGSRFGGIPAGLPHCACPAFRVDLVLTLLSPTLTVAMLGAIESLMSAWSPIA